MPNTLPGLFHLRGAANRRLVVDKSNSSDPFSTDKRSQSPTIVAIGASAGGLEPLKRFFGATIANSRFAFVVVTHLPAQHVSHLPELLGVSAACA